MSSKVSERLIDIVSKQRFYFSVATIGGATYSLALNTLNFSNFLFLQAKGLLILDSFRMVMSYDLAASVGQFVAADGFCTITGLYSSGDFPVRTNTGVAPNTLVLQSGYQHTDLQINLGTTPYPSIISPVASINNNVPIASMNSTYVTYVMGMDFYPSETIGQLLRS